jgi:hypothetical protein
VPVASAAADRIHQPYVSVKKGLMEAVLRRSGGEHMPCHIIEHACRILGRVGICLASWLIRLSIGNTPRCNNFILTELQCPLHDSCMRVEL